MNNKLYSVIYESNDGQRHEVNVRSTSKRSVYNNLKKVLPDLRSIMGCEVINGRDDIIDLRKYETHE